MCSNTLVSKFIKLLICTYLLVVFHTQKNLVTSQHRIKLKSPSFYVYIEVWIYGQFLADITLINSFSFSFTVK